MYDEPMNLDDVLEQAATYGWTVDQSAGQVTFTRGSNKIAASYTGTEIVGATVTTNGSLRVIEPMETGAYIAEQVVGAFVAGSF